ncbi:hypothetical protein [Streptomyces hoynatensis]|uniref:Uncharacterized protein n=1 Tax=Streptomyces hoynatensis TaxID=1141874 RepID=A0A3A9YXK5_9ACTN|nr:hypothetical protein [Streptomyces hoynatensis]RKN40791.1 hypothetical protein D7294_17025 [Streptomyces hoynatensis]
MPKPTAVARIVKLTPPKIKRRPSDRQRAREFARSVEEGRVYYVVDLLVGGPDAGTRVVSERQFTKKPLVGLMSGSCSPEQLWLQYGRVYTDRGHPDIRRLPTTVEMAEEAEKIGAGMLNSPGWAEAIGQAGAGTRFRSTW